MSANKRNRPKETSVIIEKFLAVSMIALGITAGGPMAEAGRNRRRRTMRSFRRRVRWLRQHLERGSGTASEVAEPTLPERASTGGE